MLSWCVRRCRFASLFIAIGCVVACATAGHSDPTVDGGTTAPVGTSDRDAGISGAKAGNLGTPLISSGEQQKTAGQCNAPSTAFSPVRRISRVEYDNAVQLLLQDSTEPAAGFVGEEQSGGFNSNTVTPVSDLNVTEYAAAADAVAGRAATHSAAISGCTGTSDTTCIAAWLKKMARKAFHGTLPDDVYRQLVSDYQAVVLALGPDLGARFAISSVLMSPRFLYVIEQGASGSGVVALTPSEIAGRLAAAIWRSVPDDGLLAVADSTSLGDSKGVMTQARTMLADPRADGMLNDFAAQWMLIGTVDSLTKDPSFTAFTAAVRQEVIDEATGFFRGVFRDSNGSLDRLFTDPVMFTNADVSAVYGADSSRHGMLTEPAVLASGSHPFLPSPILRGKLVREQLMCDPVLPPPPNIQRNLSNPDAGQTVQDVFERHAKDPYCAGCHQYMDPIGYAFSNYDAIGKSTANGGSTQGNIAAPRVASVDDVSGMFNGPVELGVKLAKSNDVKQCFQLQVLRYVLGRYEEASDACSGAQSWDQFTAGGYSIEDAIVGVVGSDAFRHRTSVTAGGACQ